MNFSLRARLHLCVICMPTLREVLVVVRIGRNAGLVVYTEGPRYGDARAQLFTVVPIACGLKRSMTAAALGRPSALRMYHVQTC